MIYRKATIKDIPLIQVVRNSVKENQLSNPSLIPNELLLKILNPMLLFALKYLFVNEL